MTALTIINADLAGLLGKQKKVLMTMEGKVH